MKTLNELYLDLKKFGDFDASPDNPELFLNTVDEIALQKDPSSLPVLLDYFDDETEYSWVMTSLRKAIEYYSRENYINSIIINLRSLCKKALIWTDEIVNSILNGEEDKKYFCTHIHLAERESLLKLFDFMEKESPHHATLIEQLRKEIEETQN